MKTVNTRGIRQVRRKTFDPCPRRQGDGTRFEDCLTPQKLRDAFREAVIIVSTASSSLMSVVEAHQRAVVAFLLTLFFLGSMYVAAHLANASAPEHKRPRYRPRTLRLTRALLPFFTVFSPVLRMFELQKAFWPEGQTHSAPEMVMMLVPFLTDFLPAMLSYISSRWPKRSRAHTAPCARSGRRASTRFRR